MEESFEICVATKSRTGYKSDSDQRYRATGEIRGLGEGDHTSVGYGASQRQAIASMLELLAVMFR